MNLHCGEIETLVATILAEPNAVSPPEMNDIAGRWNRLDTRSKRDLLPQLLDRVVWDHAAGEITLDIKDDAVERLDTALQTQTDSAKDLQ